MPFKLAVEDPLTAQTPESTLIVSKTFFQKPLKE